MLGSNDKMPLPAIIAGQAGIFVRRNRNMSDLTVTPASSFAPRWSATANCKEKIRREYTLDFSRL
jgi:hypothetical protein